MVSHLPDLLVTERFAVYPSTNVYVVCYLPIGVIRDGLTHPSIPDGWRWNGLVSDHCPVWAEFYCDRDYDRATGHVTVDDIFIDGKQREG